MKWLSNLRTYLVDPSAVRNRNQWGHQGEGIVIAPYVDLSKVQLDDYVSIAHHAQVSESMLGRGTSVGRYSKIRQAQIGRYCSIAWDVTIGAPAHPLNRISSHAFSYRKQFGITDHDEVFPQKTTVIGHDVWIGCSAILISGITVGDGAVIGAGAVVTKDVPPYAIVAGVPARKIRDRFSLELQEILEEAAWWNWSEKRLRNSLHIFQQEIDQMSPEQLRDLLEQAKGDSER